MAAQELDYITIKGFKSIASVEKLSLRPINLIIGANGSGKSNFLGAFSFLHAIREARLNEGRLLNQDRLTEYVRKAGGAEQLLHFGSKMTTEIRIHISSVNEFYQCEIALKPTTDDDLFLSTERAWEKASPHVKRAQTWVRTRLDRWRLYHVPDTSSSSPLRKTAQLNDNAFLRPDGANLPAFLYLLLKKHPAEYGLIRNTIQQVAPFFDDFQLYPDPLNEEAIRLAWRHKNSDQYFSASSLSDGTLRFIALATLFLQPIKYRPSVILVDEPELGLHPQAIALLAALIRQASTQTQVIVSTQSSLLIDYFQPEDVLVADRVQGSTQVTRLDPAKLYAWLEDYSLGQLWEKNELGGRPGRE